MTRYTLTNVPRIGACTCDQVCSANLPVIVTRITEALLLLGVGDKALQYTAHGVYRASLPVWIGREAKNHVPFGVQYSEPK